jgi:hypothetical protein
MHRGVYETSPGTPSWLACVWAGLLAAGPGSAATAATALRLHGVPTFGNEERVLLAVDHHRRVASVEGVAIRRRRRLASVVHPAKRPTIVRVEEAVLQEAATRGEAACLSVIADACQCRLTTAGRLRRALADLPTVRGRSRWRAVLDDVASGAQPFLEVEYLRKVERAHGLPAMTRQARASARGRTVWRDGLWETFGLALELDGRLGHEWDADRRVDRRRDLLALGGGVTTLRIGYADVIDSCGTAILIAAALTARGCAGRARGCATTCPVARLSN